MTFEVIDKTTGEAVSAKDVYRQQPPIFRPISRAWFIIDEFSDLEVLIESGGLTETQAVDPDRFSVRFPEVEALKAALTAEIGNRCCGNCLYMDTIFEITGERQCEITKRSADKESDPCEHWRSCRG